MIRIKAFTPGMKLDVCDTENIWCPAKILQVIKSNSNISVLIHYEGWSSKFDELINSNSDRLAPAGLITSKDSSLIRNSKI